MQIKKAILSLSQNPFSLTLSLLEGRFAVCQLLKNESIPEWAFKGDLFSVTRTSDELSIVCAERNVPEGVKSEPGWACLKVHGPFEFSLSGVLNSLTQPLANAGVGIFAISTYNTDYLMVKKENLEEAIQALTQAGHNIGR